MSDVPTPGWLARRLHRHGHQVALGTVAMGVLMLPAGAEATRETFDELSGSWSPEEDFVGFWEDCQDEYPYLRGHVDPIYRWAVGAGQGRVNALTDCAQVLKRVDFAAAVPLCGGDLLGCVHNELLAISRRQGKPMEYLPFSEQKGDMAYQAPFTDGQTLVDTACATGTRMRAVAWKAKVDGADPQSFHWYLADFDPLALALAGVNTVAWELGQHVHLALAAFPAWPARVWPELTNATIAHEGARWLTDVVETEHRIGGYWSDDPMRRAWVNTFSKVGAVNGRPVVREVLARMHGIEEDRRNGGGRLRSSVGFDDGLSVPEGMTLPKDVEVRMAELVRNGMTERAARKYALGELYNQLYEMADEWGAKLAAFQAVDILKSSGIDPSSASTADWDRFDFNEEFRAAARAMREAQATARSTKKYPRKGRVRRR